MRYNPDHVAKLWDKFYREALRKNGVQIGSKQYEEMQKSFYVGIISFINQMTSDETMANEETALTFLDDVQQELLKAKHSVFKKPRPQGVTREFGFPKKESV